MAHDMSCFAALTDLQMGTMYSNLTVAYIYALNAILVPCHKKLCSNDRHLHRYFCNPRWTGLLTHPEHMDNECSKTVEAHIKATNINIQLMLPRNHRVNAAIKQSPSSKSILSWALPPLTRTAPCNFGMSSYHRSNSCSTCFIFLVACQPSQKTRRSTDVLTITNRPLHQLEPKDLSMTIQPHMPAGCHTGRCILCLTCRIFTFQQHRGIVLPILGASIPHIVQRLPFSPLTARS